MRKVTTGEKVCVVPIVADKCATTLQAGFIIVATFKLWLRRRSFHKGGLRMSADGKFEDFLKGFVDALNEVIDALSSLKNEISILVGATPYDINKIEWKPAEGSSGAYERAEDANNPHFKALLQDVQRHGGKMTVGNYFLWSFKNGTVLGRKPRKFKDEEAKP
jgi:hypothetical protein